MLFVRPVGEVEPKNVYSGLYELEQFVIGVTGGSDGSNDLGFMERVLEAGLFVHVGVQIFR